MPKGFAVVLNRNGDPPSAASTPPLLKKRFSKSLQLACDVKAATAVNSRSMRNVIRADYLIESGSEEAL